MRFRHGDVTGRRKKGAPERKDKVGGWTNKTRGKRNKRRNEKKKKENQLRPFNYARACMFVILFLFLFSASPRLSSSLAAKGEGSRLSIDRRFKSIFGNSRECPLDPGNWLTARPENSTAWQVACNAFPINRFTLYYFTRRRYKLIRDRTRYSFPFRFDRGEIFPAY